MKLMTKELQKQLPELYSQENEDDPMVQVHYFHPLSNWDWYGIEYSPEHQIFFGFVHGFEDELGEFSLAKMESVNIGGIGIERDLFFVPVRLSVVKEKYNG